MSETADTKSATVLDLFSPAVRGWFAGAFDGPTGVQAQAWSSIVDGNDTLVVAPTGSGKTLAAFLFAIDKLMAEHTEAIEAGEKWQPGVRVLYVSPLKALGADVERNLDRPLSGIAEVMGAMEAPVTVGMRTGDTPPDVRRKLQRKPPDILITTPESLYLMLTSQARGILASVETVIIDEIHAMAGSKRGTHLSLSLERLVDLTAQPFQRIGLSATVRPLDTVARFLAGADRTVEVVADETPAAFDLSVRVPVADMTAIPRFSGRDVPAARAHKNASQSDAWKSDRAMRAFMREEQNAAQAQLPPDSGAGSSSIWPYIEAAILDEVLAHTSTIVFVNSRGLCERLTARLNELYAKRCGVDTAVAETVGAGPGFAMRSDMGGTTKLVAEPPEDLVIAKAHHGSVSKEKRLAVESELKRGVLPCVVATSSLELGIDMGEVDLVLQVAPPLSVSSGLQRIGRANHQVGGRSQGIMFPRLRTEVIDCAVISEGMRNREIEQTELVRNALDVLAQQTVAAVAMEPEGLPYEDWLATVRRSACYDELPQSAFDAVLLMLAGRYAHGDITDFAPRIHIDPETNLLKPLARTQRLAVTGAGTIPDRGLFPVMLARGEGQSAPAPGMPDGSGAPKSRKQGRKRVGELDEEMVAESRVGDVIILGTNTWRITDIADDRVLVEPAPGRSARLPFWHGEGVGRAYDAGQRKGAFLREAVEALESDAEEDFSTPRPPASPVEMTQSETNTPPHVISSKTADASSHIISNTVSEVTPPPHVISSGVSEANEVEKSLSRKEGDFSTPALRASGRNDIKIEHFTSSNRNDMEKRLPLGPALRARLQDAGLNENAVENLATLLAEQQNATGVVPTDETLVIEQCADEAGGWSMILHSPFGRRVHEPWALAIAERGAQLLDYDLQVSASDDGILMHIPLSEPVFPDPSLLVFDPDELEAIVRNAVGRTALFATRFRECAARALLMTPTTPGKRAPLWQQRLRGGQLLEAAREAGDFPLLAEAARECLQEAYDLAGLRDVMERIGEGRIRLHTAQTLLPSPFAVPLLFGYMVDHLYEGDLPHAERQSSLLSVDSTLLGELVGGGDTTTMLDEDAIAAVEAELQCLDADHKVHGIEGVAQLLRRLGPLTAENVAERLTAEDDTDADELDEAQTALETLEAEHRAFATTIGGKSLWVSADDGPRLSAVLGMEMPAWAKTPLLGGDFSTALTDARSARNDIESEAVTSHSDIPSPHVTAPKVNETDTLPHVISSGASEANTLPHVISTGVGEADGVEKSPDSAALIDGLVLRYAKTHGPFSTAEAASSLGLGTSLVAESIGRLRAQGALMAGAFTDELRTTHGDEPQLWIATDVLRRMRLRSLALAREAVKPVSESDYVKFLFARQGVLAGDDALAGIDGVAEVIAQFEGVALPKEAWETVVFPARVSDYAPAMLDELLASGEVIWQGSRTDDGHELVAFFPTDSPFAPLPIQAGDFEDAFMDEPGTVEDERPTIRAAIIEVLSEESGLVFATLSDRVRRLRDDIEGAPTDDAAIARALLDLLWEGRANSDGFALVRTTDFDAEKLTSPRAARELAASTAPRHASSRRSRSRYGGSQAEARRAARAQTISRSNAYSALAGRWSLIVEPDENDTIKAMTVVESLFDRYGIITSEIAATYGLKGGMSVLYPVLRSLEDAGEVLRGTFVDGLGNLQFAAQSTIDELREFAGEHTEANADHLVLAADDPAQLYGSILPWPACAGDTRPTRRTGALVVFRNGAPVLYAAPHLKALLSFTSDSAALDEALTALITYTLARLKRAGSAGVRTRILIETLDGEPILDTPAAATLTALGAVRDTHGLKLYASPF